MIAQINMMSSAGKTSAKSGMNLKKLSHSLSYVLRHGATDLGLPMTPDGYVPVSLLLTTPRLNQATLDDLQQVVSSSDKQRFKLEERPASLYDLDLDDGKDVMCIRANQGHTIPLVDPEQLCTRLTAHDLERMPTIVHGTYQKCWSSIRKQGLSKMKRHHIHFAKGMPGEDGVISGMRKTCNVCIYLNVQRCIEDEILFYESDNGVVLTAGIEGILPVKYFSHVTDEHNKLLLDQRNSAPS